MTSFREEVKQRIRESAKEFIGKHYREELEFFPVIWGLFEGWLEERDQAPPEEWSLVEVGKSLQTELGLGEGAAVDLVSPKIVTAFLSVWIDLVTHPAEAARVEELTTTRAKQFGVSDKLTVDLKEAISRLYPAWLREISREQLEELQAVQQERPEKRYMVYVGSKAPKPVGEKEAKAWAKKKDRFFVFVWYGREGTEVRVDRENVPIDRGTKYFKVFIKLLKRIGGDWDYEELFDSAIEDKGAAGSTKHQLVRQHIEYIHDVTEGKLKKYLVTVKRNKVHIRSDLEVCLVEEL